MKVPRVLDEAMTYISGAVGRIFSLEDDTYPKTGVQPFTGEVHKPKHHSDG